MTKGKPTNGTPTNGIPRGADPGADQSAQQSQELVRRAQAGDRAAFDALLSRNEARLARLVKKRMGSELRATEDSQDVIQSALAEAVRALPSFEYRGEGSFLRWLGTIVEHRVRNHVRALRREKRTREAEARGVRPGELAAPDPSPSQNAIGLEFEARYAEALERAAPEDKELLLLHLELGASHGEIAAALGLASPDAARMRLGRALARLNGAMRAQGARRETGGKGGEPP
jgi:RNA polymerase sigma-70 factor (ECF subfamily)